MKKASIMPKSLMPSRGGPDNWNRMHGRGRPRLHWLALLLLGAVSSFVCGQEVKTGLQSKPAGRERRALQEQWFLRGRSSVAGIGALQRYRAHLQKMQMRADRLRRAQTAGAVSLPSSAVVWSSARTGAVSIGRERHRRVQLRLGFGTRNRDCD